PPRVTSLMVVGQQNLTAGPKALGFHTKCSSQTTTSHPVPLSAQSLPPGWVSKPLMPVSVCSRCTRQEKCVVQRTQNIWHNWPQRFIKSHKPWGVLGHCCYGVTYDTTS